MIRRRESGTRQQVGDRPRFFRGSSCVRRYFGAFRSARSERCTDGFAKPASTFRISVRERVSLGERVRARCLRDGRAPRHSSRVGIGIGVCERSPTDRYVGAVRAGQMG